MTFQNTWFFHMWNFTCDWVMCFTCEISHVIFHMCFTCEILHVNFHMGFTCEISHVSETIMTVFDNQFTKVHRLIKLLLLYDVKITRSRSIMNLSSSGPGIRGVHQRCFSGSPSRQLHNAVQMPNYLDRICNVEIGEVPCIQVSCRNQSCQ